MTVIGIMSEDFIGTYGLVPTELFVPATAGALVEPGWTDRLTDRLEEMFAMTGRLRPGVTLAEAAAQLDVVADALAAEHPDASAHTELYVIAERYSRPESGAARHTAPLGSVVIGLALLVLLIAMANVGTLLVARGVERRQEMALRAGLGATRRRAVPQLVTESVLLALAGGAGGGIVAVWAADLVVGYFATAVGLNLLRPDYLVDWRVFGFSATMAMAAGVLTGLAPALRSTRIELARVIDSSGAKIPSTVGGFKETRTLSPCSRNSPCGPTLPVERHGLDPEFAAQVGHRGASVCHRCLGQPHLGFRQRELPAALAAACPRGPWSRPAASAPCTSPTTTCSGRWRSACRTSSGSSRPGRRGRGPRSAGRSDSSSVSSIEMTRPSAGSSDTSALSSVVLPEPVPPEISTLRPRPSTVLALSRI